MKLLEGDDDLSDIESYLVLGEVLRVVQVGEELAALHKIHHQVQLLGTLESVVHLGEERAVNNLLEDLQMIKDQLIVHLRNVHIPLTSRSVLVCSIVFFLAVTFFFSSTFIA